MKNIPNIGDTRVYKKKVVEEDQAAFHGSVLHAVCSTFALARDMEWSSRLFFLDMKEDDEEGVGTHLTIDHKSPAFVGEELTFTATAKQIKENELICDIVVKAEERTIAIGKTGQRMLKKDRLQKLFTRP
ncbi:MAG: hotdog domain-containing protein [Cyclobacteriaceae bacterium]